MTAWKDDPATDTQEKRMKSQQEKYELEGLPLTASGISKLILEIFEGQMVERHVIVSKVKILHEKRGGANPRAIDITASVKKALKNLKDQGIASNPQRGFWQINSGDSQAPYNDTEVDNESEKIDEVDDEEPIADLIIGEGAGYVYVYYLPT